MRKRRSGGGETWLVLMHVKATGAADRGQKAVESV